MVATILPQEGFPCRIRHVRNPFQEKDNSRVKLQETSKLPVSMCQSSHVLPLLFLVQDNHPSFKPRMTVLAIRPEYAIIIATQRLEGSNQESG